MTARRAAVAIGLACAPQAAWAHATEQAFVLLLPTDIYIRAGVAVVALTLALALLMPPRAARAWGATLRWPRLGGERLTQPLATLALLLLLAEGVFGSRDPTANLLPLVFWTGLWVAGLTLAGVLGNPWPWLDPWRAPLRLLAWLGLRPVLHLPKDASALVAGLSVVGLAAFLLADPAPADPGRLAAMGAVYYGATLAAAALFGPAWLERAELFATLFRWFAAVAPVDWRRGRLGLPGWQLLAARGPAPALALPLLILAAGSFDGLNETFLWLAWLGINPLEFPGRSAVVLPNLAGFLAAVALLFAVFFAATLAGDRLAGGDRRGLLRFAPTVMPIALAYHLAHYLPSFLVEVQYLAAALAGRLGLDPPQPGTGFLYDGGFVKLLWLSQAGAVVLGHALAILLSHAVALDLYGSRPRAALSQLPVGVFMLAYTLFGLWLLAAPKGA